MTDIVHHFQTGGDALGQEYHGWIAAYNAQGKKLGYIDYSHYLGKTQIKMVEVEPEYKKKGVATALFKKLQSEVPSEKIGMQGNFATAEGRKWMKHVGILPKDRFIVQNTEEDPCLDGRISVVDTESPFNDEVGFLKWREVSDRFRVSGIGVNEECRNQGISKLMYAELCRHMEKCGISELEGDVISGAALKARISVFGNPIMILPHKSTQDALNALPMCALENHSERRNQGLFVVNERKKRCPL